MKRRSAMTDFRLVRTIRLPRSAMTHYRLLKQLKVTLREIEVAYDPFDDQLDKDSRKARQVVYSKTCARLDELRETGIALHAAAKSR